MKKAGTLVVEELSRMATPLNSQEEIEQVATISAQDATVGKIIASAMEQVGKDGVITVEEGRTFGLEIEVTEGMKFENGYISPYMVTDTEKMESRIDDAHILITDKKISSLKDILGVLESLAQNGQRELVIIAEDIDGEALTGLILNKLKGSLNILGIKAPGFGDRKKRNSHRSCDSYRCNAYHRRNGLQTRACTYSTSWARKSSGCNRRFYNHYWRCGGQTLD